MGRSKASLVFGDECLLQRVTRRMASAVERLVVVAAADQAIPVLPAEVCVVRDQLAYAGPLAGIALGLQALNRQDFDAAYVTSCDVPFLRLEFVHALFELRGDQGAVVPVDAQHIHPLAAVYRCDIAPEAAALVVGGERRPRALFHRVPTKYVTTAQLRQFDPQLESLVNINTPDDYRQALQHAGFPEPPWLAEGENRTC